MERVAFCNTGSEAVTAAIRVARTVSGRDTIAMFAGAYHGVFDEVLVRPTTVDGHLRSVPIAPGIAPNMVENVLVLDYGSPESLRHPEGARTTSSQPCSSSRCRAAAPSCSRWSSCTSCGRSPRSTETALVFDEVVIGLPRAPGRQPRRCSASGPTSRRTARSSAAVFRSASWPVARSTWTRWTAASGSYGDDSFPEVGVTFFAGTFVRHPLALAAAQGRARAARGGGARPAARRSTSARPQLVDELNAHAEAVGAPVRVTHVRVLVLLQLPARRAATPPCSTRTCATRASTSGRDAPASSPPRTRTTTSPASSPRSTRRSPRCRPPTSCPGERSPRSPERGAATTPTGREAWFVPDPARPGKYLQVEEAAAAVADADVEPVLRPVDFDPVRAAVGSRGAPPAHRAPGGDVDGGGDGREANCSYNQCFAFTLEGPLRVESLRAALDQVVARHEGLRVVIAPDGSGQTVRAAVRGRAAAHRPVGARSGGAEGVSSRRLLDRECETPFDLAEGPLRSRVRRARVRRAPPSSSSPRTTSSATAGRRPSCSPTWGGSTPPTAPASRPSSRRPRPTGSTSPTRRARTRSRRRRGRRGLLGRAVSRRSAGPRSSAHGRPARRQDLPQRPRAPADRRRALRGDQADRGEVRGHALRDAARGVRGARVSPVRPIGFRRRHSVRRSARARQPDARRPLREHRAVASAARSGGPFAEHLRARRATSSPTPRITRGSRSAAWCGGCNVPRDPSRTPLGLDHLQHRQDRCAVRLRRRDASRRSARRRRTPTSSCS